VGFDPTLNHRYDQSGIEENDTNAGNGVLTGEEIVRWRRQAVRRFYLRPRYLLRQLLSMKSFVELKMHLKSALFVMKSS
jgi:hypothetical protein